MLFDTNMPYTNLHELNLDWLIQVVKDIQDGKEPKVPTTLFGASGASMPYTNLHELNLDWIITKVKELDIKVSEINEIEPATLAPLIDGLANVGISGKYAREDHVHPTDITRASATSLNALTDVVERNTESINGIHLKDTQQDQEIFNINNKLVPATTLETGLVKPDGLTITVEPDGTLRATGSTIPVMSQYKLTLDNNQLKHNDEVVTYQQIKNAIQDETKFVFVYWETIYMLPTFINDRVGEFDLEALEFSSTYQIQDKTVNWRVIINENNEVRVEHKNLIDESMLYDGDIAQWEPLSNIKEAPDMAIIKPFYESVDASLTELDAVKAIVVEIGQYQYSYEGTVLPAINVTDLRSIYTNDKAGIPQTLHWTLLGTENNLKVVSSDHIAANYSIDVLVHNKYHCEYVWTDSTEGVVNPNIDKQDFKTINGESILGIGDIVISGFDIHLLWENANPTSSFSPQTINLDLTPYKFVYIVFTGNALYQLSEVPMSAIAMVGYGATAFTTYFRQTSSYTRMLRPFTTNNNGVTFGDGRREATTLDNTSGVPIYIYGIK